MDGKGKTNCLGSRLRKVVGGEESSGDGGVETCIPVVSSVRDGVLETTWVLQREMELTLFRLLRWGKSWADVGFFDMLVGFS
jgi:hypothetical protein